MAVSLYLHVIVPPITLDHVTVAQANSNPCHTDPALWAAISRAVEENRRITDKEFEEANAADAPHHESMNRLRQKLAADDTVLAAAIAARRAEDPAVERDQIGYEDDLKRTCQDPFIQIDALCPQIYLGESYMAEHDHPIFDLVDAPFTIDNTSTEVILSAVRNATDPDACVPDEKAVRAFLDTHRDKAAVIFGH